MPRSRWRDRVVEPLAAEPRPSRARWPCRDDGRPGHRAARAAESRRRAGRRTAIAASATGSLTRSIVSEADATHGQRAQGADANDAGALRQRATSSRPLRPRRPSHASRNQVNATSRSNSAGLGGASGPEAPGTAPLSSQRSGARPPCRAARRGSPPARRRWTRAGTGVRGREIEERAERLPGLLAAAGNAERGCPPARVAPAAARDCRRARAAGGAPRRTSAPRSQAPVRSGLVTGLGQRRDRRPGRRGEPERST